MKLVGSPVLWGVAELVSFSIVRAAETSRRYAMPTKVCVASAGAHYEGIGRRTRDELMASLRERGPAVPAGSVLVFVAAYSTGCH